MTASEQKWAERVRGWRDSRLSARDFSEGRDFTAGGLFYWAHQLKKRGIAPGRTKLAPHVRLARVERVAPAPPAALVVEVDRSRLLVPSGFDAATLRAAIRALLEGVAGAAE